MSASVGIRSSGRPVRGVVFDLDGTLVDSFAPLASAANTARAAFALPPLTVAEVRAHVGHGMEALVRSVVPVEGSSEALGLFLGAYGRLCELETTALPGAADCLATLRARGYRLSVASNKLARYSRRILERLGLATHLDAIEGPDTAGSTKPDPAMIRRALAAMGCEPAEALYVGDMRVDATSASRAEVAAVLIAAPGGESAEDLARTGATVVDGLPGLVALLPPLSASA